MKTYFNCYRICVYVYYVFRGPGGSMSQVVDYLTTHTRPSQIWHGFTPSFVNYTRLAAQVIKFTSYLPMVSGSLRVLWLPPPLKLVTMIQLNIAKSGIKHKIKSNTTYSNLQQLEHLLGQTKDYKIGICCFSVKYVALRRKSKGCWLGIKIMCFEQSDMFTRRQLFQ